MQGQKEKDRRSRRKTKIEEGKKHEYQGKARRISEVSLPSGRVWAICAFLLDKAALAKFLFGGKKEEKKKNKKKEENLLYCTTVIRLLAMYITLKSSVTESTSVYSPRTTKCQLVVSGA